MHEFGNKDFCVVCGNDSNVVLHAPATRSPDVARAVYWVHGHGSKTECFRKLYNRQKLIANLLNGNGQSNNSLAYSCLSFLLGFLNTCYICDQNYDNDNDDIYVKRSSEPILKMAKDIGMGDSNLKMLVFYFHKKCYRPPSNCLDDKIHTSQNLFEVFDNLLELRDNWRGGNKVETKDEGPALVERTVATEIKTPIEVQKVKPFKEEHVQYFLGELSKPYFRKF